ncbi:hypothetical protein QQS21_006950 [Conoideocrella luteorostrata]|uniref:AB hydrolase-1 domain-containing protein n=1 Tax=Conoideocrella luteorostrata TaxID=1105319 RepID=A0AAJ0FZV4_9HYPO|nr:hypothetical protein QQS21_006950 [Conoideocrella luteorostrata]
MTTKSTTVLFVPGAWHIAKHFAPVAELLNQAGYPTELIELPSVGPPKHLTSFEPDVEAIRQCISKTIAAGQRVAIVTHSYGGIPASEALRDFVANDKDNIAHLYFLSSFVIPEGASLLAAFGGQDLPWFRVDDARLEVLPDNPGEIFYNDLPQERIEQLKKQLKPQSYQVMHSPLTYAAWKEVPSTYLYCTRDNAIPMEIQKMMVERTAAGCNMKTDEVDASHSPFISRPKEVADSILRALG